MVSLADEYTTNWLASALLWISEHFDFHRCVTRITVLDSKLADMPFEYKKVVVIGATSGMQYRFSLHNGVAIAATLVLLMP